MAKRASKAGRRPPAIVRLKDENRQLHTKLAQVERLRLLEGLGFTRPALTDVAWRKVKGVQEPEYNPIRLWAYFELDDTLFAVNTKIAAEVTRAKGEPAVSWEVVPKFAKRCAACGAEYQGAVDECQDPACRGVVFLDPNPTGKAMLEAFFRNLNADVPTDAILEDTVLFSGVLDNWYWWVRSEPSPLNASISIPARVDLLDARFVRAMTDDAGRFESNEWFCPTCYWTSPAKDGAKVKKGESWRDKPCPFGCKGTLQETAWVQRDRIGNIVGRWTADEVVHGKRFGGSFRLYGLSRVICAATLVEALLYQGRYYVDAYKSRRSWDGVLTLPLGEVQGKQMLKEANEAWAQNPTEQSPLILFTGNDAGTPAGDPKWLNLMGRLEDLAPLDFRREVRKAIMTLYGVGEVLTGGQTAGQLGHPEDALEASFDTVEGEQTHIAEVVNRGVVSRFPPAAQDWRWQFISPKQKDEKLDWDIRLEKVQVVQAVNAANAGVHAILTHDWEVEVEEGPPPPKEPPFLGASPFPPGTPGSEPPTQGTPPPTEGAPGPEPPAGAPNFGARGLKGMSPRDIPASDAVPGVRDIEDEYAAEVTAAYQRALDQAVKDAGDSVQPSVWQEALNRRFDEARREAQFLTERMAAEAYGAALAEEGSAIPDARFEQVDAAVLERLAGPEAFAAAFAGFDKEAHDAVTGVIARRFGEPAGLDLKAMVAEMRVESDAAVFRLDRIARSETTRIVNEARAAQWAKYADPALEEYEWVIADDERVDGTCKAIAEQNPWSLEDLRLETDGFLPHPNCRCTVVRKPSLLLG